MSVITESKFSKDYIVLKLHKDGDIRETFSTLSYHSKILNKKINIPIGTKTDLGSIPTILQWLIPKDGKAVLAYILHDYLYQTVCCGNRELCDDVLREAMEVLEVVYWRRISVYYGVRSGGWIAWNKYKEKVK